MRAGVAACAMIRAGCMPKRKPGGYRALRGGSWNNDAGRARSAYRNHDHRDNDWNENGFRFSLSLMAPGWVRWTRRHPVRPGGFAVRPAKRKNPGVLVGPGPDGTDRTLPGCSLAFGDGTRRDVV
jgi:hypothetical protein